MSAQLDAIKLSKDFIWSAECPFGESFESR